MLFVRVSTSYLQIVRPLWVEVEDELSLFTPECLQRDVSWLEISSPRKDIANTVGTVWAIILIAAAKMRLLSLVTFIATQMEISAMIPTLESTLVDLLSTQQILSHTSSRSRMPPSRNLRSVKSLRLSRR